jgi:hypothetical protein
MDELTRFARVLVERLGAHSGTSIGPVSVRAIRMEILPYRAERRNLGLSSIEDYETVLLRLVAEEKGFVKTAPGTAAERCRKVLATPNPDLGVLEEIAESTIQFTSLAAGPSFDLTADSAARRLDVPAPDATARRHDVKTSRSPEAGPSSELPSRRHPEGTRATPRRPEEPPSRRAAETPRRPEEAPSRRDAETSRRAAETACPHCNQGLPSGRVVVFCPWCGQRLVPLLCEQCGAQFESEWRHCIACGSPVRDPHRPS